MDQELTSHALGRLAGTRRTLLYAIWSVILNGSCGPQTTASDVLTHEKIL